ncbi:hypothetical protein SAMN02745126_04639 [Enhydrobacter aerosaccus]|uniref:Uncharacterized protein n=2 Tax=Enhydrobacter aerosaccus TaxID=225324 RepID=A0A1T4SH97_9HYPH|nr:hypothetical protein SAMN02745126_04639 [Enhydrobacter aerosaccus]
MILCLVIPQAATAQITIGSEFTLSPDGSELAFGYRTPKTRGSALYNWKTGLLRATPFMANSYSTDGKKIAGHNEQGLLVADASDPTRVDLVPNSNGCSLPVFQPGNKTLLCIDMMVPKAIRHPTMVLIDIQTGQRQIVLGNLVSTFDIAQPSFVSPTEFLFGTRDAPNNELRAAGKELGAQDLQLMTYRFRFGSTPQIAFPDVVRRLLQTPFASFSTFVSSEGGRRTAFVGRSNDTSCAEPPQIGPFGPMFRYDVYAIENGVATQITRICKLLGTAVISQRGNVAAFSVAASSPAKPSYGVRGAPHQEPWLVDLVTKVVTPLQLPARIAQDPRFN